MTRRQAKPCILSLAVEKVIVNNVLKRFTVNKVNLSLVHSLKLLGLTKGVHQLVDDVEDSHPQRNPWIKGQSLELLILGIWLRKHLLENFRYHGEKRAISINSWFCLLRPLWAV
jgi:hypothetical protein